jgi:hypothetical protein
MGHNGLQLSELTDRYHLRRTDAAALRAAAEKAGMP